jgi:hypothetical protein
MQSNQYSLAVLMSYIPVTAWYSCLPKQVIPYPSALAFVEGAKRL